MCVDRVDVQQYSVRLTIHVPIKPVCRSPSIVGADSTG